MFAMKETKRQIRGLVPPIKRQNSQDTADGTRKSANSPGATHFLQRHLGNSYMQSVAGGQQSPADPFHQNPEIGKARAKRGQPELTISQPSDSYEQDADRVVHHVTYPPTSSAKENEGEKCLFNPAYKVLPHSSASVPPNVALWLRRAGAGRPLSDSARHYMEQWFNADFADVRIHTGEYNEYTASLLGANAFTYKNHIFLGKGRSESDHSLLAHELAHTLQQSGHALNKTSSKGESPNVNNRLLLSHITDPTVQRDIDYPSGTGRRIGDVAEAPWYAVDYRLDNVRFIHHRWPYYPNFPSKSCVCDSEIKVRVEEYSSTGFVGAINKWDYVEVYCWNYEYSCTGTPEGECPTHHHRELNRVHVEHYDERGDAPGSDQGTLSLLGDIASILGLVVSLIALGVVLAAVEPGGGTSKEAIV